ncbi:MAG TPA: endonuclease/exonuclease/phosphatase family protein [Polyangiaceae bacterium]|nr:endonuclease/exonuclease/phosphatase family protein [Polyangiaceae bacterium]
MDALSSSLAAVPERAWRLALLALLALGCDPFHTTFDDVEDAKSYRATKVETPPAAPASLLVMNYNVKFGGARIDFFFDCHGDRVLMTEDEVISNLQGLASKINQVDPDLLVVQEIDINSKRAAYVDQMQWLLDHTSLNYGVYASQWKADYVPSDGIGAVDSGNAILSKFPLTEGKRIALSLRTDQSGLERYFYLRRNILRARLELPGQAPIYVLAIHAEAYAKDGTKKQHIDRFKQELDALSADGSLVIGLGDLNTLPPGSEKTSGFPDSVCKNEDFIADDYSAESDWLVPFYESYAPEIPLSDYQADNASYFSHTTDKNGFWNRKLDYIFTNGSVLLGSGLVHQDEAHGGMATMPLSDHAPVTVEIELP